MEILIDTSNIILKNGQIVLINGILLFSVVSIWMQVKSVKKFARTLFNFLGRKLPMLLSNLIRIFVRKHAALCS